MNSGFRADSYWKSRVTGDLDIGVVGHRSLGRIYNLYIYKRRVEVLNRLSSETGLHGDSAVLDIGCGSGFYTDYWRGRGIRNYTGIDISRDSIDQLASRFVDFRFINADISDPAVLEKTGLPENGYDVITVFDVLYHIVDDKSFSLAVNTISRLLKPGGHVLVFDQLCRHRYSLTKHVIFRNRKEYLELFGKNGFELIESRRLFQFLVPPLLGYRYIDLMIAGLYKILGYFLKRSDFLSHIAGKILSVADRLLLILPWNIPNNDFLVFRKKHE